MLQTSLQQHGTVYLTDIIFEGGANSRKGDRLVAELVGDHISGLLRHCHHLSPGVHSPSFFALFSNGMEGAMTTPQHNESHRVAAWHLLLRHPKPLDHDGHPRSSESSCVGASTALTQPVTAESLSIIYRAIAAKSDVYAGSDHLLDDVVVGAGRKSSSARELYPGSVSLTYGELTEESCRRVIHALQLTPSSRLLDIGSAFGRFCVYAALATGASVTGVEAGIKRAELASQFLEEIATSHSAIVTRSRIKLVQGDILRRLPELFAHSHVFLFDARFVKSTWCILAHLLSYLGGVQHRVIIWLIFESAVHGLGVRAVRTIRAGQVVMRVDGELIFDHTFAQQSAIAKLDLYAYMTRMPSHDRRGKKAFMHAWDISRYINSHVGTGAAQNVELKMVKNDLYVMAIRDIRRQEELLHDYKNWSTDPQSRDTLWTTDHDLQ